MEDNCIFAVPCEVCEGIYALSHHYALKYQIAFHQQELSLKELIVVACILQG